ncbi:hypothetical protein Golob_004053 [Gossypium lobatum]|uniref:Uncharacterized protein n=1 Tax=Gossypium lobatum TaxID=34289 RepID=A0A7J8N0K6_9ROSI|nr:hypothetical protein [Gossypium lobatum]
MEKGFLDKVEDNTTIRIFSETMVIFLIYSMSKWINTYFELLPSIGIPPIANSLLERS